MKSKKNLESLKIVLEIWKNSEQCLNVPKKHLWVLKIGIRKRTEPKFDKNQLKQIDNF